MRSPPLRRACGAVLLLAAVANGHHFAVLTARYALAEMGVNFGWIRPGAFCTDGCRLYEVVKVDREQATYENCVTFARVTFRIPYSVQKLWCVKQAPSAPENAGRIAV